MEFVSCKQPVTRESLQVSDNAEDDVDCDDEDLDSPSALTPYAVCNDNSHMSAVQDLITADPDFKELHDEYAEKMQPYIINPSRAEGGLIETLQKAVQDYMGKASKDAFSEKQKRIQAIKAKAKAGRASSSHNQLEGSKVAMRYAKVLEVAAQRKEVKSKLAGMLIRAANAFKGMEPLTSHVKLPADHWLGSDVVTAFNVAPRVSIVHLN